MQKDKDQSGSERHVDLRRDLRKSDRLSLAALGYAVIVGALAGLIGVLFQLLVGWMIHQRPIFVSGLFSSPWTIGLASFAVSGLLAGAAYFLVNRFSPESGGSGIHEIEAALLDLRPVRWWRVLPVKFIGGVGSLGAGMVLGREGPTVQMGGNLGQMVSDLGGVRDREMRHALLCAGSAGGLAAAFNAPLAGILFVIEEMRAEFKYSLISIKAVVIGAIMSTIVYRAIAGQGPILLMGDYAMPPQDRLWLYFVLGLLFGAIGVGFNKFLLSLQRTFQDFYRDRISRFALTGACLGGCCGLLGLYVPRLVGDGFNVAREAGVGDIGFGLLLLVFLMRFLTSTISYSSGAPGGIFSPLLALGATFGGAFGFAATALFPHSTLQAGSFAIAGMGGLFAATVRAPLTGAILMLEMTSSYALILPTIITCLGATIVAQILGGRPLYTVLMENMLERNGIKFTRSE